MKLKTESLVYGFADLVCVSGVECQVSEMMGQVRILCVTVFFPNC